MFDVLFAVPGELGGGCEEREFDRRLLSLMPAYGVRPSHIKLPGSFPDPAPEELAEASRLLTAAAPGAPLLLDGPALAGLPVALLRRLNRTLVALVHRPLSLDPGLSKPRQTELRAREKEALAVASRVIATSRTTRRALERDFGVEARRLTLAEPGTDPAPRATGTGTPIQLLAVGAVAAVERYDVLIEALNIIADLDWRLSIAGALDRDAEAVDTLETMIATARLDERIKLAGQVVPATLERLYGSADIFVMPARHEGYSAVLAQAMARGLPIVCASGGAAAETVPAAAAITVPAGDVQALAAALAPAIKDRKLRRRLADAAWDAGRRLPTWNETARRVAAVLMGLEV